MEVIRVLLVIQRYWNCTLLVEVPSLSPHKHCFQFGAALFLHVLLDVCLFYITVVAATSFIVVILCTGEAHPTIVVSELVLLLLELHLHKPH